MENNKNCLKDKKNLVVFLDFDGVINTFLQEGTERFIQSRNHPESFEFCDKNCIENLNEFFKDKDFDIVISSTWRFSGISFCVQYLKQYGFIFSDSVIDTTQLDWKLPREEEIMNYLKNHPYYLSFLIFDDMEMPKLKEYLVQTNPFSGFDKEKRKEAEEKYIQQIQKI